MATGCTATDQVLVTVDPLPGADAGPDRIICNGIPVQIGGSPTTTSVGATYVWDNAASLTSSTISNPTANPAITTSYSVTVTSTAGCTSIDQVLVTVNSNPVADAGSDQDVCLGLSTTIGGTPTGTAGSSFQWDNAGTLDNATSSNPSATPLVTTTYTVTVTSGVNCTATDNVTITVLPNPSADAGVDQSICVNGSVAIGGSPTSTTVGATFAWDNAGTLTSSTISNPTANPTTTTTYTVTVTHPNACTATDQVVITVNSLPTADAGPDLPVCNGSVIQIGGSPTGSAGATFTWDNGGSLSSTTIANPMANPIVNTTYSVTVTNSDGCTSVDQMNVTVGSLPVADAGADQIICENSSVMIGGSPTGPIGTSFQWNNSGSLDNPTQSNPIANPTTTTTYTVTVTDVSGCSQTDQVLVTVLPIPDVDAGADQVICNGLPVLIGGGPTSNTPGAIFAWDNGATLSGTTIANPIASPSVNTTYTVTVTHPNGCTSTDQIIVNVNGLPVADAGIDVIICNGENTPIGGSPTGPIGATFVWDNGGSLSSTTIANPIANPVTPTTYTVTITDANGCVNTDQIFVDVLPLATVDAGADITICQGSSTPIGGAPTSSTVGATFAWDNAGTLSNSAIANPTANPTITTTYSITVTHPNGCTVTDDMMVVVSPAPVTDAGVDQDLCINGSTTIGGSPTGPVGSIFAWDNAGTLSSSTVANPSANPIITTTYTVTVTDLIGCTNTDAVTITINPLPIVDAGVDQTICDGDNTPIGGTPTGPAGSTYIWDNTASLSSGSVANPIANPTATTTYSVTVTDGNGCTDIDQVFVTVNPVPGADAGLDQTICNLGSVVIGGMPTSNTVGASFAWDNGGSLSDVIAANPVASPTTTTTYTVTVTHPNFCTSTDQVVITVNVLPSVDAGPDLTICLNETTPIGGSPTGPVGSSFVWDNGGSLSSTSIANPIANPTVTTTYSVTVTDGNGCTGTDQVLVTVNDLPNVSAGADVTICEGSSTPIGGSPTSTTVGATFAWDNAGTLTSTSIENPVANPIVTTTYVVTVTHPNGCTATDDVIVNVNPAPVTDAGADQDLCINSSTMIGGSPTGPTGATYAWDNAGTLSSTIIANPIANPTITTTYTVTVTDVIGCTNTDAITITVNPLPIVDAGSDQAICIGDNTPIGGAPTGPAGSMYVWDNSGSLTSTVIANPTANPTVTTTYSVTVTDVNGCINTDQVVVTVNPLPNVDAGIDQTICNTGSVTIGGMPTSSTIGVTYAWDNGASLSSTSIDNPVANPSITTTYTVTVTEIATGCFDTDQVVVTVNPLPIVDAGLDISICINGSTPIGGAPTGPAGSSYLWDNAGSLTSTTVANPTANPTTTTTYSVTVTDGNGCTDIDQMTVTVNPLPTVNAGPDRVICNTYTATLGGAPTSPSIGATYVWAPASSLNNTTDPNPTASPSVTTTYTVTVTDANGCTNTDQVTIGVNPLPTVDFTSTQVCLEVPTQFMSTSSIALPSILIAWDWDFGDASGISNIENPQYTYVVAGSYDVTLVVTSSLAGIVCTDMITKTIVVDTLPTADAGADRVICELDTIQLGKPAVVGETYQWDNAATLSNATIAEPRAFPSITTTYTVTVTNTNGCDSVDQVVITVNPAPNVDAGPDLTTCNKDTVVIGGAPTSITAGVTYLWNNASSLDDATLSNPKAFPTDTTIYTVTVTDASGCTSTDMMQLNVNPLVMVDFQVDAICEADYAAFTDLSTISAGSIASWNWNFGDGVGISILQNPGYLYAAPGDYDVKLIVISNEGCVDSITKKISILALPIADAGGDKNICFGDTVALGGSPTGTVGSTYSWAPGFDLSSVTESNPMAYPLSTTAYYLTVTGANGCFNFDTTEITVNALPMVVAEKDSSLCVDQAVQLSASGASAYTWSPSIYLDDPTIFNPIARALKNTTYVVSGTDVNGCISTDTVEISVFNVDFTVLDTSICLGDSVELIPIVQGDTVGGLTYSWTPTFLNLGLNNPTISNPKASPNIDRFYVLEITNANGCVDKDSVEVKLKQAVGVDFEFVNTPRCSGAVVELVNTSTSTDNFLWKLNGLPISEERDPEIGINNLIENTLTLIGSNSTCTDSITEIIPAEGLKSLLKLKDANVFTPNGDGINDIFDPGFEGEFIGCVDYQVFDRWGDIVFDSNIGQYGWDGRTLRGRNAATGMYYYVMIIASEQIRGSVYLNR
ncbi:MAG: gliding motility-associated C-terminal domain-containing protein [Flavobacteriales bacterium]|nr:gliding motility-associated C-terminal domain-containing protein [Flavobacteriales bacterium]